MMPLWQSFPMICTSLSASTYLGGGGLDYPFAIAIDSSDNVFVTRYTGNSGGTAFPVTDGAYSESRISSSAEVLVSKFSNDLTSLSASTILGGTSDDWGLAIAIDSSNSVFVAGRTSDHHSTDLPATSGAYDESHNGGIDAFVSKSSNDVTSRYAATFVIGSSTYAIIVMHNGIDTS